MPWRRPWPQWRHRGRRRNDGVGMVNASAVCTVLGIITGIAIAIITMTGITIIQPYEQGLLEILGSYKRILFPGFNYTLPLVSKVHKVDLRTKTLNIPRKEVVTKNGIGVFIDMEVRVRVRDARKAWYEVDDYKEEIIFLSQDKLKTIINYMEYDALTLNTGAVDRKLRYRMNKSTVRWGVSVISVDTRLVDPRRE